VERERLIQAFNKEEYWTIEASFLPPKGKAAFPAILNSINGKRSGKWASKAARRRKIL
jgi:DNA topoisomerase IA